MQIWTRLIVFVIRLLRLGKAHQERYWGITLPTDTVRAASTLINAVRSLIDLSRPNDSDSYQWERSVETPFWESRILTGLHRLSMTLITPAKRERSMQSYPIVYFAGVLALTDTGSYLRVRDYIYY